MNEPRLLVPSVDPVPFPTLGPEVCDFIEAKLVHGPGDVLGRPAEILDEVRLFIYRLYEVYPRDHPQAGRRRFKRSVLSRRKGFAKTEIGAWLTIVELDPEGPVRCDGWREEQGVWVPVGRSVTDPYIPIVATGEDQAEELGYGAVKAILENCDLGNFYDIGLERIMHRDRPGKVEAVASSPNARDGARTSFQWFDETHRFIMTRLKEAHATMLRNIPKRMAADAHSLETSTMYGPGEDSIAEMSHRYAEAIAAGQVEDPRLLFDHRQASETHDLETKAGLRAAIIEASGDALVYTDVESVAADFRDPNTDKEIWRRWWLNQRRRRSSRWLPADAWERLAVPDRNAETLRGQRIVLWFDGSYARDSTVLGGTTIEEKPHSFLIRAWERPPHQPTWRTPVNEVKAAVEDAMESYEVVEFAPDPPGWRSEVEEWEATYGETVVRFDTNQPTRMGPAADEFEQAVRGELTDDGEHVTGLTHDGDPLVARHVGNCVVKQSGKYRLPVKESQDSPLKIDAAIGEIVGHNRARWHFLNTREEAETPFAYA